ELRRQLELVTQELGACRRQAEHIEQVLLQQRQRDHNRRAIGMQIDLAATKLETARAKLESLRNDPVPEVDALVAELMEAEQERDALVRPSADEIDSARAAVVDA